jgi:hypothetical protein
MRGRSELPSGRAARGGLRRRVRSERAHCSSEQREGLDVGADVLMLAPRALDDSDHLRGRMDVDVLAEGADRQKSAGRRPDWTAHCCQQPLTLSRFFSGL